MIQIAGHKIHLTAGALKLIAVFTMLIDHVAAILIVKWLVSNQVLTIADYNGDRTMMLLSSEHSDVITIYQWMRDIGRIAFPIYCYMLVEGFVRTRNVKKYLGRMVGMAFLSEIPFDLAFAGQVFYWDYQNVLFTLVLGLSAMCLSYLAECKISNLFIRWSAMAAVWGGAAWLAEWMKTDYAAKGVLCIGVLYICRYVKELKLLCGGISFYWEFPAPLAFLLLALYNGEKGIALRKFFYMFYPAHLLILYLLSVLFGMGNIAAI